jgi:hypothetical protein
MGMLTFHLNSLLVLPPASCLLRLLPPTWSLSVVVRAASRREVLPPAFCLYQ